MPDNEVVEGAQDGNEQVATQDNAAGSSDFVPKHQYVGLQAKFNKKEAEYQAKVSDLEKRVTGAVSAEEHNQVKAELETLKAEKAKADEANQQKALQELSSRKEALIKKGVPEADVKDLDDKSIALMEKTLGLGIGKPKPDLQGTGGGTAVPKGSPMELARMAYTSSNRSK